MFGGNIINSMVGSMMEFRGKIYLFGAVAAIVLISTGIYSISDTGKFEKGKSSQTSDKSADGSLISSVELNKGQLKSVKVEQVVERTFVIRREAVGSVEFNQDMTVHVFPPYQGKIISLFAKLGDEVVEGQKLYTIDSPDFSQAESSLIAADAALKMTGLTLERAKYLHKAEAISQKELDQAISDQQSAEGALQAARNAVRLFGKTEAETDEIIAQRKIDPMMVVPSPITGRVTARNAAPGLFVQPGTLPAPYAVADISTMWVNAFVVESDSPLFQVGQKVQAKVTCFPDRVFEGKISVIGESVDPTTHRLLVRSEIGDPKHELRPGMFATITIDTGDSMRAPAVCLEGVIREGDGTMTVWVTTDRRKFIKRRVKVGLQQDGYHQIVKGLQLGELIATEGALFLSNALALTNTSR